MTYAIIGSGAIGTSVARQFARLGKTVSVANARGPETIEPLVAELGGSIVPTTVEEALKADLVVLAVPFEAAVELVKTVPDWKGRIIVDTTNALNLSDFSPLDLGGKLSTQVIAEGANGALVVKGFNHNWAHVLGRDPSDDRGGHRVLFVSGNDPDAKKEVTTLMTDMGFHPIDLGRYDEGGKLATFGGPLTTLSLVSQLQGGASASEMDLVNP